MVRLTIIAQVMLTVIHMMAMKFSSEVFSKTFRSIVWCVTVVFVVLICHGFVCCVFVVSPLPYSIPL